MATVNKNFKVKNGLDAEGDITTSGGKLQSTASSGDEGGEIFLNKAVTNTTLNGGVTIDVYQNKLRFFEQGGTARGYYIDITTGGAGVGTNLVGGGSSFTGGTLTSDLVLAAGSASVEPLRFQTNSVAPTATSGAWDYDGDIFYATTSGTATGRLMTPVKAMVFSNANATAATTNSSQSIFQSGARALTLEAAKTYYFRLNLGVNFTFNSVPAAIQLVPTFSQTPVAINYSAVFASGTSGGVQSFRTTSTSAVNVSPTLSASVTGATILVEGFFRSNATTGGTVEFKYQISTGGGSSATAQTGSLLEITKIGTGAPGIIAGAWA